MWSKETQAKPSQRERKLNKTKNIYSCRWAVINSWYSSKKPTTPSNISFAWDCLLSMKNLFLAFQMAQLTIAHLSNSFKSNFSTRCLKSRKKSCFVFAHFYNWPPARAHTFCISRHSHKMWLVVSIS